MQNENAVPLVQKLRIAHDDSRTWGFKPSMGPSGVCVHVALHWSPSMKLALHTSVLEKQHLRVSIPQLTARHRVGAQHTSIE